MAHQRCFEIGEGARPFATRGQQLRPGTERRQQPVVDRQSEIVGALGFLGPAQRFEGAAAIVRNDGVVRFQPCRLAEGDQRLFVPAELDQAAGEVGLCRDIARQELGGALQRLAGLGE